MGRTILCFLWGSLLVLGCSSEKKRSPFQIDLIESADLVKSTLMTARFKATKNRDIHFVLLTQEVFYVYQDKDHNMKLNVKKDRKVWELKTHFTEKGLRIIAPKWYACDARGRPAWASGAPQPPSIIIRDFANQTQLELSILETALEIKKRVFRTEGEGS